MIQLNLLPDIKQQYIKARKTRRLVMVISIAASVISLVIFMLSLVSVEVVQRKSIRDLNKDIGTYGRKLTSTPDLNKILTVQNQLNTLTPLHDQKVVTSRLFSYIAKITPPKITISNLNTDFTASKITVTGEAPDLGTINTYVDSLKATTFTTSKSTEPKKAFNTVVLSAFGRDSKGATYTIDFSFDQSIFGSQNTVSLTVPNSIQTNATKLFEQQADK